MNVNHEKTYEIAELFKVLSNNVRLCILTSLCVNEEKKVTDLTICSNSSQSFVSQQLIKLKHMGIIEDRKEGSNVYYKIKDKRVKNIIKKIVLEE